MKTFYTMMDNLKNIHLVKDVGMIPYVMHTVYNYDGYIVAYGNEEKFTLKENVEGLKIVYRRRYTGNCILDGIIWLIKNARKIDILNLYHYKLSTFIWIIVYKLFHFKGQVYLKLDIDAVAGMKMKMKKGTIKYFLTKNVLGMCDLISCETKKFEEYANKNWPIHVQYIPNGILEKEISVKNQKEKIIMTVGRMGTQQKATEILLEAYEIASTYISKEWKLVLVGSMTEEFEQIVKRKQQKNKNLKIEILGHINDRKKMQTLYEKCAIFVMSSRWESFGIAAIEALAKGCYLLLSNIVSFSEFISGGKYGKLFQVDNIEECAKDLIEVCQRIDNNELALNATEMQQKLINAWSWERICGKIDKLLN